MLFVSDIEYRKFFAFRVNYRYRFVFVFKQHRLLTLSLTRIKQLFTSIYSSVVINRSQVEEKQKSSNVISESSDYSACLILMYRFPNEFKISQWLNSQWILIYIDFPMNLRVFSDPVSLVGIWRRWSTQPVPIVCNS